MSEQLPENGPKPGQARKNKLLLLLLLASFVIPFVVGELAYKQGWYKGAQINKGHLLQPPAAFADLHARDVAGQPVDLRFVGKEWWLVYVLPADCAAACRNRLFQMREIPVALGRESERVRQLVVQTVVPSAETEALINSQFSGFARLQATAADIDAALARADAKASQAGLLYIMDPMGWIMLTYPPEADEKTSVIKAENTLDDLRKLLKNSRIG